MKIAFAEYDSRSVYQSPSALHVQTELADFNVVALFVDDFLSWSEFKDLHVNSPPAIAERLIDETLQFRRDRFG